MNKRNIVPFSYALTIAFFCFSLLAKATNSDNMMAMLIGCLITQLLFACISIYELRQSEQLTKSEKSNWTAYLLIAPPIFGIFYLTTVRRKLFSN